MMAILKRLFGSARPQSTVHSPQSTVHSPQSEMADGSGLQVLDIAHVFWSPLQPMVFAAIEKFGAGMVTQWVENLLRLMQTDFRAEAAHNRFEALGIKMLCSKPL